MEVDSLDQETVILLPNDFLMVQPKDMTLFTITKSALENASFPMTGIRMKFSMKRKITSEMMTTYFPSFLLMMITYATTFFKPFFFEAALSVNLTTMLVMTTIFISKMESLPATSDTKMIDYWLILCQLAPFTQVVLLTAMEYLKEEKLETEEDKFSTISLRLENGEGVQLEMKEGWKDPKDKRNKVICLPTLLTIGKFHSLHISTYPQRTLLIQLILVREKGSALDSRHLLHRLLWNSCILLFLIIFPSDNVNNNIVQCLSVCRLGLNMRLREYAVKG